MRNTVVYHNSGYWRPWSLSGHGLTGRVQLKPL